MEVKFLTNNNGENSQENKLNFNIDKKSLSKIGFVYSLLFLIPLLLGLFAPLIGPLFMNYNASLILTLIFAYCIPLVIIYYFMRNLDKTPLKKKKINIFQFASYFIIAFALIQLGYYIINLFTIAHPIENPAESFSQGSIYFNFIYLVLLVPIMEELIFRKFLIDHTIKYGSTFAILFSAMIFALFHRNFFQLIYTFLIGAFFASVYIKTGNIKYTILLHSLINFSGSILPSLLSFNKYLIISYSILSLCLTFLGIIVLILFRKHFKTDYPKLVLSKGDSLKLVFKNWGIVFFIILWIIITIFHLS